MCVLDCCWLYSYKWSDSSFEYVGAGGPTQSVGGNGCCQRGLAQTACIPALHLQGDLQAAKALECDFDDKAGAISMLQVF